MIERLWLLLAVHAGAVSAQQIIFPQQIPDCRPLRSGETYASPTPPPLPPPAIVYNNLGGMDGRDSPPAPPGMEWPPAIRIRYVARHPNHFDDSNRWLDVLITNTSMYWPFRQHDMSINRMTDGWMSINLMGPDYAGINATGDGSLTPTEFVRLNFRLIDGNTPTMEWETAPSISLSGLAGLLAVWDLDTEAWDANGRALNGRECVSAPLSPRFYSV